MTPTNSNVTISNGKVVEIAYTLTNNEGEVLDQSDKSEPFAYLHGGGQIVEGLEEGLEGLSAGNKKKVTVSPEKGYGDLDPTLKLKMERSRFPADAVIEVGMEFEARTPDGDGMVFLVESIETEHVHLDGNHPLAGETLHFDVEVLTVREASGEELEHGHAHGPDGHHH